MNTIDFNQNITEDNFTIYKRKNSIIIQEIVPFIHDVMKIVLYTTAEKKRTEPEFLPLIPGDKKSFDYFTKDIINAIGKNYHLNSDLYNFKNCFFPENLNLKKSNKPRNVEFNDIHLFRRYNQFILQLKFNVKFIIKKQLIEKPVIISCVFCEIVNDNFELKSDFFDKLNKTYNIENHNQSVEIYEKFLLFQNQMIKDYKTNIENFNNHCHELNNPDTCNIKI